MKKINLLKTVFASLFLACTTQLNAQEIEGGTAGHSHDIWIVNSDESSHDAGIRLQTRNGNSWKDWNIWNNRQDGKLHFSYWAANYHNDHNENDVGTYRMTLQNNGYLGLGTTAPSHIFHIKANGAVGLLESTSNTAYLRLSTNEGFNNRVEFTNRAGGRAAIWVGGASDAFNVLKNGKVGVGTTSPSAMFQVEANSSASPSENGIYLYQSQTNQHSIISARVNANGSGDPFVSYDVNGESGWSTGLDNSDGNKFKIAESWSSLSSSTRFTIERGGEVGIGTTTPTAKLDVVGSIKASGSLSVSSASINGTLTANRVTVNVGSFPDYVFEDDYKLQPLSEVEKFIKENKHLPKVPSAKEVEQNGMNVGELNVLMMEKIEELTLHLIEQQKRLEQQAQEIEMLKKGKSKKKRKK